MHRPKNTTNELEREIEEVHPITKHPENPLASNETNSQLVNIIRGNLGSKMGLIRKRAKINFCELEFKNQ